MSEYTNLSDAALAELAQSGHEGAAELLLARYGDLVRDRVKLLAGAEREDLLQPGMIGLWAAIVDFAPAKAPSFPAFAEICIDRQVAHALDRGAAAGE